MINGTEKVLLEKALFATHKNKRWKSYLFREFYPDLLNDELKACIPSLEELLQDSDLKEINLRLRITFTELITYARMSEDPEFSELTHPYDYCLLAPLNNRRATLFLWQCMQINEHRFSKQFKNLYF